MFICMTNCWLNYRVWCALHSQKVLDVIVPVVAEHYKLKELYHLLCTVLNTPWAQLGISPHTISTSTTGPLLLRAAPFAHAYAYLLIRHPVYYISLSYSPDTYLQRSSNPTAQSLSWPLHATPPPPTFPALMLPLLPLNLRTLAWATGEPHWLITSSESDMSYGIRSQGCSGLQTYSMLMTPRKSLAVACISSVPRQHKGFAQTDQCAFDEDFK